MWDDGEFVNGIDRTLEPARFAAAKQAWFDYQPVMRRHGDPDRTYREITWGDLASFLLLDVRQYRDPWPPPGLPGDRRACRRSTPAPRRVRTSSTPIAPASAAARRAG
jgi:phosphodiesterase/alkaline phosphatase D-like protein